MRSFETTSVRHWKGASARGGKPQNFDVLAAVEYRERRFWRVPRIPRRRADISQELHLYGDRAVALASFAAALNVERKNGPR